jgi:hypothetical protein
MSVILEESFSSSSFLNAELGNEIIIEISAYFLLFQTVGTNTSVLVSSEAVPVGSITREDFRSSSF